MMDCSSQDSKQKDFKTPFFSFSITSSVVMCLPRGVSDITLLLSIILGCVIWLRLKCTSQSRTFTQENQHTSTPFSRLSNRKSNTIINTASCKRQTCALLLARCFPQFLCAPSGLLHHSDKSLTCGSFFFFVIFFYHKLSWLSGSRLTTVQGWMETYVAGPTEDGMDSCD